MFIQTATEIEHRLCMLKAITREDEPALQEGSPHERMGIDPRLAGGRFSPEFMQQQQMLNNPDIRFAQQAPEVDEDAEGGEDVEDDELGGEGSEGEEFDSDGDGTADAHDVDPDNPARETQDQTSVNQAANTAALATAIPAAAINPALLPFMAAGAGLGALSPVDGFGPGMGALAGLAAPMVISPQVLSGVASSLGSAMPLFAAAPWLPLGILGAGAGALAMKGKGAVYGAGIGALGGGLMHLTGTSFASLAPHVLPMLPFAGGAAFGGLIGKAFGRPGLGAAAGAALPLVVPSGTLSSLSVGLYNPATAAMLAGTAAAGAATYLGGKFFSHVEAGLWGGERIQYFSKKADEMYSKMPDSWFGKIKKLVIGKPASLLARGGDLGLSVLRSPASFGYWLNRRALGIKPGDADPHKDKSWMGGLWAGLTSPIALVKRLSGAADEKVVSPAMDRMVGAATEGVEGTTETTKGVWQRTKKAGSWIVNFFRRPGEKVEVAVDTPNPVVRAATTPFKIVGTAFKGRSKTESTPEASLSA